MSAPRYLHRFAVTCVTFVFGDLPEVCAVNLSVTNWPFSSAITGIFSARMRTYVCAEHIWTRSIFNILRSDKSFVYQLASRTIYVIFIVNITRSGSMES